MKIKRTVKRIFTLQGLILSLIVLIYSCHSGHDEPTIIIIPDGPVMTVCNDDAYDYTVFLYSYPEEYVVRSTYLTSRYDEFDQCDEFSDLDEGRYFITIVDEDCLCEFDRTDVFYADHYETYYFYIDHHGSIVWD